MGGCSETPPLSANNEVGASVKPLLETKVGGLDRALDVESVEEAKNLLVGRQQRDAMCQ
jgi:hypothetical protein